MKRNKFLAKKRVLKSIELLNGAATLSAIARKSGLSVSFTKFLLRDLQSEDRVELIAGEYHLLKEKKGFDEWLKKKWR